MPREAISKMRVLGLFFALLLVAAAPLAPDLEGQDRPNIVLVLVDDMGWADPGFMGNEVYLTPNLDRLASEGMIFTDAYAACANCAPSRAAIVSGQYAPRTGVYTVLPKDRGKAENRRWLTPESSRHLPQDTITIGRSLGKAGYRTASIGKWHLGDDPEHGPLAMGFDRNVGGGRAGHPKTYLSPYQNADLPDGPDGEHLTARLAEEAKAFITEDDERPFFLYFSTYAVHTPLQPDPKRLEAVKKRVPKKKGVNRKYAALVEDLDAAIGSILQTLEEEDLARNTLVIFTSDNGGHGGITANGQLRGAKGMFYEGGIRVPMVMRWPGHIEENSRCDTPVIGVDLFPTICKAASASLPRQSVDGEDLTPLFAGEDLGDRSLFWHFPAYLESGGVAKGLFRATPCAVVRQGPYKLLQFYEDGHQELYDLRQDPGEAIDLSTDEEEIRQRLQKELSRWQKEVAAPIPHKENPRYQKNS